MACGIIVPQPGIEPIPSAVEAEAQSLNQWTTGKSFMGRFLKSLIHDELSDILRATTGLA